MTTSRSILFSECFPDSRSIARIHSKIDTSLLFKYIIIRIMSAHILVVMPFLERCSCLKVQRRNCSLPITLRQNALFSKFLLKPRPTAQTHVSEVWLFLELRLVKDSESTYGVPNVFFKDFCFNVQQRNSPLPIRFRTYPFHLEASETQVDCSKSYQRTGVSFFVKQRIKRQQSHIYAWCAGFEKLCLTVTRWEEIQHTLHFPFPSNFRKIERSKCSKSFATLYSPIF